MRSGAFSANADTFWHFKAKQLNISKITITFLQLQIYLSSNDNS